MNKHITIAYDREFEKIRINTQGNTFVNKNGEYKMYDPFNNVLKHDRFLCEFTKEILEEMLQQVNKRLEELK